MTLLKKPKQDSFLDPSYKKTTSGHKKFDGVQFHSYHVGVLTYAQISADGKIMVRTVNAHRHGAARYVAAVIGHGTITTNGNSKRFHSEDAACRAGVKVLKEMAGD
jgi:hypothetical protein